MSGPLRERVQAEAGACDERQSALGSAHESCEVVAGDVLDDLAARVRDRAVAQNKCDAEDEVPRCAEPMAQRTRDVPGEQRPDGRVARRVEREPLTGASEGLAKHREPNAALDGAREIAGVVLQHACQSVRCQIDADTNPPPFRVRGREGR